MNQDCSAAAVLLLDCLGMHGASREVELAERYASEAAFVRMDPQAKVDQLLGHRVGNGNAALGR